MSKKKSANFFFFLINLCVCGCETHAEAALTGAACVFFKQRHSLRVCSNKTCADLWGQRRWCPCCLNHISDQGWQHRQTKTHVEQTQTHRHCHRVVFPTTLVWKLVHKNIVSLSFNSGRAVDGSLLKPGCVERRCHWRGRPLFAVADDYGMDLAYCVSVCQPEFSRSLTAIAASVCTLHACVCAWLHVFISAFTCCV